MDKLPRRTAKGKGRPARAARRLPDPSEPAVDVREQLANGGAAGPAEEVSLMGFTSDH
jgi:hypothetical protein